MFNVTFYYYINPGNEEFRITKTLNFIPTENMVLNFNDKPLIKVKNVSYLEKYNSFLVGYDFH